MTDTVDTADEYRVEAGADKELFVSMLVKDIELLPAVIDLVDNSVDSSRATTAEDLSTNWIRLIVSSREFSIEDNCGGIDVDVARHYAFRFGRPKEYSGVPGSVGQFGVGMKRALFKLGREFVVNSRTTENSFTLPVNVDEWLAEAGADWQFRMSEVISPRSREDQADTGTKVTVTRLHQSVAEDFGNELVVGQLREQIRLRHQSVLQQGLKIVLNGEVLTGLAPKLMLGPSFSPINRTFVIRADNGGEVNCRIVAGVAGVAAGDTDARDDGDAEEFMNAGDAGWWLFCNDRLLLFAERTNLTGWGDAVAAYHPQYRRFRGYVYLTSLDTSLLPWNTTKTGVDTDSRIWRQVQSEMKTALGQVIAVINRMKAEKQHGEDADDQPVMNAYDQASPVLIRDLPDRYMVSAPQPRPVATPPRPRPAVQKIQFNVDKPRFKRVSTALDETNVSEIGRIIFDYFYDREIED